MALRILAALLLLVIAALVGQDFAHDTPIIIGDGSFFIESPKQKFGCWDGGQADELGHKDLEGRVEQIRIRKYGRMEYEGACPAANCRLEIEYGGGKARVQVLTRGNSGKGVIVKAVKPNSFKNWKRANDYRFEFDGTNHSTRITSVTLGSQTFCTSKDGNCQVEIVYRPKEAPAADCR